MKKILLISLSILLMFSLISCSTKGEDGKTPYIQNGYWYINGVNTGVKAEGVDGTNGSNGTNGENGAPGQNGADGITPEFKIENGELFVSYMKLNRERITPFIAL